MLHELQTRFRDALLSGDADALADLIVGGRIAPAARLQIHRNNLFTSLTEALATHFPVIKRLVGDGFFAYAAHQFIRELPPTSPCLGEFGARFSRFLERFEPARTLPYLGDVARLEWAIVDMLGAPRADAIDLDSLAGLQPDQIGAVQLVLDPALRFLASTWPVDAIWMANQPDRDGALALDDRPGFVQVRRLLDGVAGPRVEVTTLEEARFTFRRALALGLRLGDATASALAVDPLFDLALGLSQLFADRLVVRLWAPSPEPRPAD